MPSFTAATAVSRLPDHESGDAAFSCLISDVWSVNGTPHGGYLLSVLLSAVSHLQKSTNQPHCANLMASFFRAARDGPGEVRVKIMKKGLRWTNIEARMFQKGELLIVAHLLYTMLPPLPGGPAKPYSTAHQNLLPRTPSRFAPKTPFLTHPSLCSSAKSVKPSEPRRRWTQESVFWFAEDCAKKYDPESGEKGNWMRWSEDPALAAKRHDGTVLEWGGWMEFTAEEDKIDMISIPFFADIFSSIPELFPTEERIASHYYPTLSLSMNFHCALPLTTGSGYLSAPQTVGCYSGGKLIHEGRHEQFVEVWTAPGPIGAGESVEDWQKKSMLLATATQIALSVNIMKTGVTKL